MGNILILENDKSLGSLIVELLKSKGHKADLCTDAEHALINLRNNKPDIFITDLFLQGMSGEELIKIMEKESLTIPTIVISGFIPNKVRGELEQIPFVLKCYKKPFDLLEFSLSIDSYLDNFKKNRA